MTLKFTIDTCCVIDGARQEHAWREVDELVDFARQGVIELWLAVAFDGDQRDAKEDNFATNLSWLADRPVIGRTVNPARLDYSEAELGGIALGGESDGAADATIQSLLPRKGPAVRGMHPKIDDIHHLTSHRMQGNDVFVTRDSDMLKVRDQLLARVGITVETPAEAVARARQHRAAPEGSTP